MNHSHDQNDANHFRHQGRRCIKWLHRLLHDCLHRCIRANCAICHALVMNDGVVCEDCQTEVQRDLYLPQQSITFAESWAFSECWATVAYAGLIKTMIHQIKFQHRYDLIKPMLRLVHPELQRLRTDFIQPTIVCALPSHARAVQQRGFDLTHLLMRYFLRHALSHSTNSHIINPRNLLIREPVSPWHIDLPQHQQPSRAARLNAMQMHSPFRVSEKGMRQLQGRLNGATVIVCDDVITTGATLDAAARVLRQAGAERVIGWVLARTPSTHQDLI